MRRVILLIAGVSISINLGCSKAPSDSDAPSHEAPPANTPDANVGTLREKTSPPTPTPSENKNRQQTEAKSTPSSLGQDSLQREDPVIETLNLGVELLEQPPSYFEQEFNPLLQSIAADFPLVEVSTDRKRVKWQTRKLFQRGITLDAIRFRSPLNEPADLYWIFACRPSVGTWYIAPSEGVMRGFNRFQRRHNIELRNAPVKRTDDVFFQMLSGGEIQPQKEYLLWFSTDDISREDLSFAILLTPRGSAPEARNAEEIAVVMDQEILTHTSTDERNDLTKRLKFTSDVAFTPDGKQLVTGGTDGNIKLLQTDRFERFENISVGDSFVNRLVVSPDGKLLAISKRRGKETEVELWDLSSKSLIQSVSADLLKQPSNSSDLKCFLRFSRDGSRLYILLNELSSQSVDLVMWGIAEKKTSGTVHIEGRYAVGIECIPGSDRIAMMSTTSEPLHEPVLGNLAGDRAPLPDTYLTIWDSRTLERADDRRLEQGGVRAFAVSSDGKLLAIGTDEQLVLWNLGTMSVEFSAPQGSWVTSAQFSPDDTLLAIGRQDGTVRLWDITNHRHLRFSYMHGQPVDTVRFSPSGDHLITIGHDRTMLKQTISDSNAESESQVLTNSIGMRLKLIPAGSYYMGSENSLRDAARDERPIHRVEISRPFYIGLHEVTVGQFRQFIGETRYVPQSDKDAKGGQVYDPQTEGSWKYQAGLSWKNPGFEQDENHPVVQVSWYDAQEFCKWLSEKERVTYRLPTEAEWEYACRGGTPGRYYFGDQYSGAWEIMNAADLSFRKTLSFEKRYAPWDDSHPATATVGSFDPNPFGLYDMSGNAYEWCEDWYDAKYYSKGTHRDPRGPASGQARVVRGGSFLDSPRNCRSAYRERLSPSDRTYIVGFRVVRVEQ